MIIDFHSHILPGIDDGSQSVEESLQILELMKNQGIEAVIATPHFYASEDYPKEFIKRREDAKNKLFKAIDALGDEGKNMPKIYCGAEVAYYRGMSQSAALKDLVIEGTKAIMVEMPMGKWTSAMYSELEEIHDRQGLIPIVAHVDRYLTPLRDFGIPDKLAQLPVLVQANGSFFLKKNMAKKAIKLLGRDMIHLLGSDTHNTEERAPNLGPALDVIKKSLGHDAIERIESWQGQIIDV